MRILCRILSFFLAAFICTELLAQDKKMIAEDSQYVVIGAFNLYENATRFADEAKKQFTQVDLAFNENKNLYYIFITRTDNRALAIEEVKKLQGQSQYSDAWVYGKPAKNVTTEVDIIPGPRKEIAIAGPDKPLSITSPQATSVNTSLTESNDASRKYFFKVYSSVTGDSLHGNIDMINAETNKKSNDYPTNKSIVVKPANKTGDVQFSCEILGYRGIKRNINLKNPLASADLTQITEKDGEFILPFELVRLKTGDIVVMYDLFFYKDAAIIRGESRPELVLLLTMLKENPEYKIRLHGHTNGGGSGKIIKVGPDKNFFSLTGSNEGFGSAVKLSEERANVVKEYLVSEGIDEKRIEVKAWGGKKPIYDVEHALAQSNVRVEVEILED